MKVNRICGLDTLEKMPKISRTEQLTNKEILKLVIA